MNGETSWNDVYSDWVKCYLECFEVDFSIEPLSLKETNEEWRKAFYHEQQVEIYDCCSAYLEGFDSIHGTVETDYRLSVEDYNEELRKYLLNVVNIRSNKKHHCPISA